MKDRKPGDFAEKKAYAFLKETGFQPTIPERIDEYHDIGLGNGRNIEVKFDVMMDSTRYLGIEWGL